MKKKILKRIRRRGPDAPEERKRLRELREKVQQEFPPLNPPRLKPATSGIAARIRAAREAQGLTWYAVAKRAGIPNPSTVRDIEYGRYEIIQRRIRCRSARVKVGVGRGLSLRQRNWID
jgi:ribosome-binding protein aMBF1 (putative translation factor)